ncbi:MAG: carbon storage regulator [Planctomycetaceae bacterium]
MLVLSRKVDESIVLPDLGITIKVVSLGNGRVRLGVDAPREVTVLRSEILEEPMEKPLPTQGADGRTSKLSERKLHV